MESDGEVELQPLTQKEEELEPLTEVSLNESLDTESLPPPCFLCWHDNQNKYDSPDNVVVPICRTHNCYIHIHCIARLMGKNYYTPCPSEYECLDFHPQLFIHDKLVGVLDYGQYTITKMMYTFWFVVVVISIFFCVAAGISISECEVTVYQNTCFVLGVLFHSSGVLLMVLLFFYYIVDISTYMKYESNIRNIRWKLICEMLILGISMCSNILLLVVMGEILEIHLVLAVWIFILSGVINPIAAGALLYRIFQIFSQLDYARVQFTPIKVVKLQEFMHP